MIPADLISRVEEAGTAAEVRRLLQPHKGQPGLSQAFFDGIVSLLGSNPAEAKQLASKWRIFLDLGDDPGLALRAKGAAERLSGQWAKSVDSLLEAGRRARSPVNRLAYSAGAVESLGRLGRVEDAVRLGRRLSLGLARLGEPGLSGRVRLNVAAALLWADKYGDAQRWLHRARREMQAAGLRHEDALAAMSLSTCAFHSGDPREAVRLAEEARRVFLSEGHTHLALLSESNVAQGYLQIGRADEALDILLRLREAYAVSPPDGARVEEFLGDAYLRLNLPEEAKNAYETALASSEMRSMPVNRANCMLGLSQASRAIGLPSDAARYARRAEAAYRKFGNQVWANVAGLAKAEALLYVKRYREALSILSASVDALDRHHAQFALAEARLALAAVRLAQGEPAAKELAAASQLIRRRGMSGIEWRLHELYALAEPGLALQHYRRMHQAMIRSRAALVSTVAKASYLRDKSDAISRYLGELLASPTPRRIQETLDVIRTTRSIALIDEAISAAATPISRELADRLDQLRSELQDDEEGPATPGAPVRKGKSGYTAASAARKWLEWTRDFQKLEFSPRTVETTMARVIAQTSAGDFVVEPKSAIRLADSGRIYEKLRWLRFELFAPLADRNADPAPVQRLLEDLYADLMPIFKGSGTALRIAPEGDFWSIPWPALTHLHAAEEPVLALGPGFGADAHQASLPQRPEVVIFYGPHKDLSQLDREVDVVLQEFPDATVLLKSKDIREFLQSGHADLLHVACHARLSQAAPMFSYLQFEDGRVHAGEIARSGMTCGLATLSACDTGNLSLLNRYEPEGLVRSFLARRAKAALASLWVLDDEASLHFTKRYYSELSRGRNVGAATLSARQDLRTILPHPYFWAPMVLFGGYKP